MIEEMTPDSVKQKVLLLLLEENHDDLADLIDSLSGKEIVHLIGHLSGHKQIDLFTLLSPEEAAEVMEEIPEVQAVSIIEELETEDAAAILNEMESDDQADLIMELDDVDAQAILSEMEPEEAASVRMLLNYESDTAGGMMHTEYFSFLENQSIQSVTDDLRKNREKYQHYQLKYIFVTTTDQLLKGVLSMQDLLLAQPEIKLSEINIRSAYSVNDLTSLDDLNDFFHKHELFGVPVTNDDNKLVGVILRKDILEAQTERATMEHLETQGIVGGEELRTMPVLLRAKRRLSWLSVNIFLNIIAASVIAYHQDILSSVISLAVFLPIISDMSGCSGNQAVAVSMRELS